jgi:GxxExxY protein
MLKYEELTDIIIKTYYEVYNELGYGFLENVYQNAMFFALQDAGLNVEAQWPVKVFHRGREVGKYFADIMVNDLVILELKAVPDLLLEHELQLVNYLKATHFEVGLLFNFGKEPKFKRKVWGNKSQNFEP